MSNGPIAVGGIGGSGTRVIASLIANSGVFIGTDLNESLDNLWFSLLFVDSSILQVSEERIRKRYEFFRLAMTGKFRDAGALDRIWIDLTKSDPRIGWRNDDWLNSRYQQLYNAMSRVPNCHENWGWKSPNTHMIIDRLNRIDPTLRYIHVMRHGLDMAFSSNQNQLRIWGPEIGLGQGDETPQRSLTFWCWVHRRIQKIAKEMGTRFFLLNFDELCNHPQKVTRRILEFIGCDKKEKNIDDLSCTIVKPPSIGRWKKRDITIFRDRDLEFVKSMGFSFYEKKRIETE